MMRLSAIQMSPGQDKAENIDQARTLMLAALQQDAPHLLCLPEMWTCLGGTRATKWDTAEPLPAAAGNESGGEAYEFLRQFARAHGVHVHGGSIAERSGDQLFNTTVVFNPLGQEIARYRKIHLFDVETPDGRGYRESSMFGAGDDVVCFEGSGALAGLRVGCSICYDLRFPELFQRLRQQGADLILVPAAFTVPTGRDHWDVLLRARAIETQCWIAAPATCGLHYNGAGDERATYGHSLICDPWGRVVADCGDDPGWTSAELDLGISARVRADMPVFAHRRLV